MNQMNYRYREPSHVRNYHLQWLRNRELGLKPKMGSSDAISRELYTNTQMVHTWNQTEHAAITGAGIFNLSFSPDGSLLCVACENKSVMMFDPWTYKLIHSIKNAHDDCVNCIKFLDDKIFASCSDDNTIALWDTRYTNRKLRNLEGHSNWVKNIEYLKKDKVLLTSGFDGAIFAWDIKNHTEDGVVYNRVLNTNGLMRIALTPDETKLVICTSGGYMMVLNNLNLETVPLDLEGFRPNMFRLMQINSSTMPIVSQYSRLFNKNRTRNRVEFITDFAPGEEAEVISSLQIHPRGWCCLSRNITRDEESEWTCIHNIDDLSFADIEEDQLIMDEVDHLYTFFTEDTDVETEDYVSFLTGNSDDDAEIDDNSVPYVENNRRSVREDNIGLQNAEDSLTNPINNLVTSDVWEAVVSLEDASNGPQMITADGIPESLRIIRYTSGLSEMLNSRHRTRNTQNGAGSSTQNRDTPSTSRSNENTREQSSKMYKYAPHSYMHKNMSRLTHYTEETTIGKGFIKELCFSTDGKVICSPFGLGIRMFAFNEQCEDYNMIPKKHPVPLRELGIFMSHDHVVLSTAFSPRHYTAVSGCQGGQIVWYQPVFC